jgi:hypothetical protein
MIDRAALLMRLRREVTALEDDMRIRVAEVNELAEHFAREHGKAIAAGRTAMSPLEWREGEITQAAVAWVLGCVFVRFLEDNHLIDQALLSGPGDRRSAALGRRDEHFRSHPEHSDREYLEAVFSGVAKDPLVAALYDARHNPLWRLGPTADGARALRELWTEIDPGTGALVHDFTDERLDTRFLGDLYQDLSEAAKKRYALLQTPIFVEEFILDRTLDPAIAEFGLEQVRLIDPTCGSGHFLIGAFMRIFRLWQEREPGTTTPVLAQRALDAVFGVDLNPYATAIARFRLLISALRVCNIGRLAEAPGFKLNLATGDSLLHGTSAGRLFGGAVAHGKDVAHVFEAEDAAELERILGQGYHAVVGNPPYIAVSDSALRDAYRDRYLSCHGKYVLTVPFMERFFELARPEAPGGHGELAGFVGKITGNNFMKREFGAPLVEKFLASVDLQTVIDASGAYIPGHGTPTVILFGRSRPPVSSTLRVLDGIQGEPSQPVDPAQGQVWTSIKRLIDMPGTQDRFMRSSDVQRVELSEHPMTLGIGRGLRKRLEERGGTTIRRVADEVGITAVNGEDDVYTARSPSDLMRLGVTRQMPLVVGDLVRDWSCSSLAAIWTFDAQFHRVAPEFGSGEARVLWMAKPIIRHRRRFGTPMVDRGLAWFEWQELYVDKLRAPLTITWGEVATHNHFVLDRGGKVFKQTAPVIKLSEAATENEHLALLGVLNSSTACFWLKQVCHNKGSTIDDKGARQRTAPFEDFYQYNATKVESLPIPTYRSPRLPRALDRLAVDRASLLGALRETPQDTSLRASLEKLWDREVELLGDMVSLQEELDWEVLSEYGVVSGDPVVSGESAPPLAPGQRAFEIVLARQVAAGEAATTWFERHGSTPITELPTGWPDDYRELVQRRIELIESDPDVALIERPEHKRRWAGRSWEERQSDALRTLVLDALEDEAIWKHGELRSAAQLTDLLRGDRRIVEALEFLAEDRDVGLAATVERLVIEAAVPHLAALRLNEKGLRKRAEWEQVWELQRAEDRIDARTELPEDHPDRLTLSEAESLKSERVGTIPVPPRYASADFRSAVIWRHRGKLDVPKERFVLYPDAGRGADTSAVLGWAGWNERDRTRALATRIVELREQDAALAERLAPLVAGILELLPWIHQWYPGVDPAYGGAPGPFFEDWLDQQLAELSLTRGVLRTWRPTEKARSRRKRVTA